MKKGTKHDRQSTEINTNFKGRIMKRSVLEKIEIIDYKS